MPDPAAPVVPAEKKPEGEVKPGPLDAVLEGDAVPEKWRGKKIADLITSNDEAQKKITELSAPKKPEGETKPGKPEPVVPAAPEPADEGAILEMVGLKGKEKELGEQWKKDGKLSDEVYAAFKAKGFPKAAVDAHFKLAARAARADELEDAQDAAAAVTEFGGQEQVETLRTWAATEVPPARLKALGDQYTSGAISYVDYLKLLAADHAKAVGAGKAKPLIAASGTAIPAAGEFKTSHEMHAAMAEAEKKYGPGQWNQDAALMARIAKTPRHIRSGV